MDFDSKILTNPLTAGALGAVIGLKFVPGVMWIERFINFCAGMACSSYLAPAVSELLGLATVAKQNGLAFAMGLFSVSIAAAIFEGIRALKVAEIFESWAKRRGGP
jgi:hypothetical protein